ncbi:methionine sulfoxide reductase SelR isoform X2 [Cotesia typhae]|uniref:methionine sulfoxide reductase SelR isoform X2 n=1 Tax=Cotesia typhae TaxID=2053667 RepID=UPI003D68EF66
MNICRNLLHGVVKRPTVINIRNFTVSQIVFNKETKNMSETNKEELKKRLTLIQWHVTQEKGTERPFTGCYNKFYEKGTYTCIVCDQELFSSETKYDSGCGWPAFNQVLDQGKIKLTKDTSHATPAILIIPCLFKNPYLYISLNQILSYFSYIYLQLLKRFYFFSKFFSARLIFEIS